MSGLLADLRYGIRRLTMAPGFTAAAMLTIALGVGVNTGLFSVMNGLLFRDLPVPEAGNLVAIRQAIEGVPDRGGAVRAGLFSVSEYRAYRDGSETLTGLAGVSDPFRVTLGGDVPSQLVGVLVTCGYLDVMRQPPASGRTFTSEDCGAGSAPVVIVGHETWTTAFGADPAIAGRTIELNGQTLTVVGVAAEGTYGGFVDLPDFFAPVSVQPVLQPEENVYDDDQNSWLALIGRRGDDVSIDQSRAELSVVAARIDAEQPGRTTTLTVERATPLLPGFIQDGALRVSAVAMAAFGLVLLIACANVANLLLTRATARAREIAVRLSLGASRARVVRQLLIESLLLSVGGGLLGSVAALWSLEIVGAASLPPLPVIGIPSRLPDIAIDVRVLSFSLGLTALAGVLSGLAPALRVSNPELNSVIKQDSLGPDAPGSGRWQAVLVGAEVAICVVLTVSAGLLVRGLYTTYTIDPAFDHEDVYVVPLDLGDAGYEPEQAAVFRQRLLDLVAAQPGVEALAYARREPLSVQRTGVGVRLPGEDESQSRVAERNEVTPGYFSLVDIPIVRGRAFTDAEVAEDALVAVVTEATAASLWPGQDPIGQPLLAGPGVELRVIGVARDAQVTRLGDIDPLYVYLPAAPRVAAGSLELLVRSRAGPDVTTAGVRAAVGTLDPDFAVSVWPLERNLASWRSLSGSVTGLAASLGTLALVLASVGIYGVVSHFVGCRLREIGIRMALGASAGSVVGLVLGKTMRPVVAGAGAGLVAAVATSGALSGLLFGVSPVDARGLGFATLLVLAIAAIASVLPARRGLRGDPMTTLRYE